MKSYTDLEQSKKLAEFLPLETADMYYWCGEDLRIGSHKAMDLDYDIPCWSLAALLNILPSSTFDISNDHYYRLHCNKKFTEWHDNSIDACVEMIVKLHELNLL
jgi:hypothetical protein